MKFINMTNNSDLTPACRIAEDLINNPLSQMHQDLLRVDYYFRWSWDNKGSNLSDQVECRFRIINGPEEVKVFTYRPKWPFTKAVAYADKKGIHFNIYKVDKTDLASKVGTLLHEYAHKCEFGHGNNFKTEEKVKFSIPYWLSSNVSRWS